MISLIVNIVHRVHIVPMDNQVNKLEFCAHLHRHNFSGTHQKCSLEREKKHSHNENQWNVVN